MLPKRRSGLCFRFAGGQEAGLSPSRIDLTASRPTPALTRTAAPPCAAPTRPARGVSGFWIRQVYVPGHALHEKGLQRKISVGTFVCSQGRRALFVSLINRGETGDEPVVNRRFCSSVGFKYELDCSCFRRDIRTVFSIRWRARGRVVS